jgi:hypothetical protein
MSFYRGLMETTLYNVTIEPVAENNVTGVQRTYSVITEAKTVEDLEIAVIEPYRMQIEWTGTEKEGFISEQNFLKNLSFFTKN